MDLPAQNPDLNAQLLGERGEEVQMQAWEAVIELLVRRSIGAWRIVGAGQLGTRSGPMKHSLEVRR